MLKEVKLLDLKNGRTNQTVLSVNKNTEISVESSVFLFIDESEMRGHRPEWMCQSGVIAARNDRQNSSMDFKPSEGVPSESRLTNALPTIAASDPQFITCLACSG